MEVLSYPEVSIITVNYNGKKYLDGLFRSIKDLRYPSEKIRTLLVDNSSTDGSVEFVKKSFPWVDIIRLEKNTGYSGGNNEGLRAATGEFVALINNDCIVDRDWLSNMVNTAIKKGGDEKVGSVCPKVLFFYKYIPLLFTIEYDSENNRFVSIRDISINCISKDNNENISSHARFLNGFLPGPKTEAGEVSKWQILDGAVMAAPLTEKAEKIIIGFSLSASRASSSNKIKIRIFASDPKNLMKKELFSGFVDSRMSPESFEFTLKKEDAVFTGDIINSCGIELNKDLYARDRGGGSWDTGQFSTVQEVFSPSGSSLLIKREMLDETGLFDAGFFTYYEDVDLFWRARLKGWKSYFTPDAVTRHFHCGTGKEWSYSFTYHVLRNRLLMVFKCGWTRKIAECLISFKASAIVNLFAYLLQYIRGKRQHRPDIRARIRIIFELVYLLPLRISSRIKVRKGATLKDLEILKWLQDF